MGVLLLVIHVYCFSTLTLDVPYVPPRSQSPRHLMLFGMVTQVCSGCIIGLTGDLVVHIVFRFVAAVCCAQMYTAGQMICKN